MKETSEMYEQLTSLDTHSATSSLELEAGVMPSDLLGSPTSEEYGLEAVHASRSRPLASAVAKQTTATSGPPGSRSSASADLQLYLVSRLKQRLGTAGGTLFRQTWKEKITPAGWRYWAHTASGRRTEGSGCISSQSNYPEHWKRLPNETDSEYWERVNRQDKELGYKPDTATWPSPTSTNADKSVRSLEGSKKEAERKGWGNDLCTAAMSSWPTPNAMPPNRGGLQSNPEKAMERRAQGHQLNLDDAATLAAWTTPQAHDVTPRSKGQKAKHGTKHGCADLNADVALASWPTPQTFDASNDGQPRALRYKGNAPSEAGNLRRPDTPGSYRGDLKDYAGLTSGPMSAGSPAATANCGQLNPRFSLWLMGYPTAWASYAERVMLSARRQRKRS